MARGKDFRFWRDLVYIGRSAEEHRCLTFSSSTGTFALPTQVFDSLSFARDLVSVLAQDDSLAQDLLQDAHPIRTGIQRTASPEKQLEPPESRFFAVLMFFVRHDWKLALLAGPITFMLVRAFFVLLGRGWPFLIASIFVWAVCSLPIYVLPGIDMKQVEGRPLLMRATYATAAFVGVVLSWSGYGFLPLVWVPTGGNDLPEIGIICGLIMFGVGLRSGASRLAEGRGRE